jgi:hypothetical protein
MFFSQTFLTYLENKTNTWFINERRSSVANAYDACHARIFHYNLGNHGAKVTKRMNIKVYSWKRMAAD